MKLETLRRFPIALLATIALTFFTQNATAASCLTDKGRLSSPMAYGSAEQIKDLQSALQAGCEMIGRTWSPLSGARKFLVLDSNANVLVRVTANQSGSPSWETWSGFTNNELLNNDPAAGFNLPNYSFDSASASNVVTTRIGEMIEILVSRIQ